VSLTDAGRHSCNVWESRLSSVDEPQPLRTALEGLVSQFALELPWYPASYGSADPSVVGGMWAGGDPTNGIPPHGQDWKPVLRGAGDTVSSVPLTALLSQALLMFAVDYEAHPMWPLSHTTLIVQHVPTDPWPLDELAFEHDITGNGKSILERHGVAVVTKQAKRKLVALTPYGRQIRNHHEPYLADTEAQWRERYGDTAVDDLRAALGASPYASDESLPAHVVAPLHRG
jgi:hypothetical protein